MPGPIATMGSMHVCPMCSGTVPHVGGPVSQGTPNVLVNGKPVATVGSACVCVGPPDVVISGESNVFINGMPVATLGSATAHGGNITIGEPNVLVNTGTGTPSSLAPVDRIELPEIKLSERALSVLTGQGKQVKEATKQQQKNQEEAKENGFLGDFSFSV
ncbi:PAAR domain-containing protein [Tamlana agarivorans]|uniref:PAAR domain-containing protein n=1 Tax=Pseudotamlana agarivorans TaxID=481183 RepID=A0ACC5UD53_9FLAO|nr:PAAR domain-containing protein [Tamlana agarivorans]MBU2952133.1 PAAR domain-containing protein [Tamlana agarivorans]